MTFRPSSFVGDGNILENNRNKIDMQRSSTSQSHNYHLHLTVVDSK